MNQAQLCSLLSGPVPMGDHDARLPDEYWFIRDVIELEDECEPPIAEGEELIWSSFSALDEAQEYLNKEEAHRFRAISAAHHAFFEQQDLILAESREEWRITDAEATRRAFIAEIATRLLITERAAATLVHEAVTVVRQLPQIWEWLQYGYISAQNARTAAHEAWSLPDDVLLEFDEAVVGAARTQNPSRFRATARKIREQLHPESIQKRKDTAFESRQVDLVCDRDGMGWFGVYHSADVVQAASERTRALARRIQVSGGDDRTLQQIEADLVIEHLAASLNGTTGTIPVAFTPATGDADAHATRGTHEGRDDGAEPEAAAAPRVTAAAAKSIADEDDLGDDFSDSTAADVSADAAAVDTDTDTDTDATAGSVPNSSDTVTLTRAQLAALRPGVTITVPVLSLLGLSAEPAVIDGYGPIDPATASTLVGSATSFTRVLTDPVTGRYECVDPTRYRLSEKLKREIRLRDMTCDFPDCDEPAWHCEVDHIVAWNDGGLSTPENLMCLCRKHHTIKHTTRWTPRRQSDGAMSWTSPTGRSYSVHRDSTVRNGPAQPSPVRPSTA